MSEPILYTVEQAAAVVSLDADRMYREIRAGKLAAKNVTEQGEKRHYRVTREALAAWVDRLPDA